MVAGEVRTNAWVDIEEIVRKVVTDIGYDSSELGFDGNTCAVLNGIGKQSADIAVGVDEAENKDLGAGDQGLDVWLCHQRNRQLHARSHSLRPRAGAQASRSSQIRPATLPAS